MGLGLKACIGIAAFLLVFGGILSYQYRDLQSFFIVLGCAGVFLLITLLVFGLTLLASDPHETYEMTETFVKSGSGKSSVYFEFRKAKTVIFSRKYIELQGKIKKTRIYTPAEDSEFIRDFIRNRLPEDCRVRYE